MQGHWQPRAEPAAPELPSLSCTCLHNPSGLPGAIFTICALLRLSLMQLLFNNHQSNVAGRSTAFRNPQNCNCMSWPQMIALLLPGWNAHLCRISASSGSISSSLVMPVTRRLKLSSSSSACTWPEQFKYSLKAILPESFKVNPISLFDRYGSELSKHVCVPCMQQSR